MEGALRPKGEWIKWSGKAFVPSELRQSCAGVGRCGCCPIRALLSPSFFEGDFFFLVLFLANLRNISQSFSVFYFSSLSACALGGGWFAKVFGHFFVFSQIFPPNVVTFFFFTF